MARDVPICRVTDLPDPGKAVVEIGDRVVALFHVNGEFFAIDDTCTHDGGPLAEGDLEDHLITCPRHGARFDIRTGAALSLPATAPTPRYEVRTEDGRVLLRLED